MDLAKAALQLRRKREFKLEELDHLIRMLSRRRLHALVRLRDYFSDDADFH
jgi:hypothetical protein